MSDTCCIIANAKKKKEEVKVTLAQPLQKPKNMLSRDSKGRFQKVVKPKGWFERIKPFITFQLS